MARSMVPAVPFSLGLCLATLLPRAGGMRRAGRLPDSSTPTIAGGVGYQFAVAPDLIKAPLTPTFNHEWILTARVSS